MCYNFTWQAASPAWLGNFRQISLTTFSVDYVICLGKLHLMCVKWQNGNCHQADAGFVCLPMAPSCSTFTSKSPTIERPSKPPLSGAFSSAFFSPWKSHVNAAQVGPNFVNLCVEACDVWGAKGRKQRKRGNLDTHWKKYIAKSMQFDCQTELELEQK